MRLGGDEYGKRFQLRSEKNRRWAKMRREQGDDRAGDRSNEASVEAVGAYLAPDEERKATLKRAAVAAIVVHFVFFALIFPSQGIEVIPLERTAATVVKRWTPPAPPAKAKKTRTKKKAAVVPIPDPTPDDPEPIEMDSAEYDYGEFDEEFQIGEPSGVPGVPSGSRQGAYRAGEGGVMAPVVVRQVDPEYTPEATRKGIQGEVWIEAVVDVDGSVVEPRLLRGLPDDELNRRAMEAIQRWTFKPGTKDGAPVAIIAVFTVTYRLH